MSARLADSDFCAPALSAKALQRLLAMQGYREADRAAIRAFGRVISRDDIQDDFLAGFLARAGAPVDARAALSEAEFCDELLNICFWKGEPDWFDRLATRWCACLDAGVGDDFPWSAGGALMAACRERLVGGRAAIVELELDLLTGLLRVIWALSAHLANVALARERTRGEALALAETSTRLPNRVYFERLLSSKVTEATENAPVGLIILRLLPASASANGLIVEAREQLRRQISDRLREVVREGDILCVTGGDEWALVQSGMRSPGQTLLAANKLQQVAECMLGHAGPHVRMAVGAGCASAPADGRDAATLERAARAALFVGGNRGQSVTMFDTDVAREAEAETLFEQEFTRALHLQRFELYLQPQVTCGTGRCSSVEALLRWQREDGQWVPPPAIIDVAARLGMVAQVSRLLIARVARIADELARADVDVRIMLNLTATDVRDVELPDLVAQSLANWRVPPGRVGFELTEGAVLSDDPVVEQVLSRLRAQGAIVALDDFGTGYSSLAHLRRLPIDELKIDRQFVSGIRSGHRDAAIVEAVLALARAYDLETVAEGVETQADADVLSAMGCDRLQGYLFARPASVAEFIAWWHAHHENAAAALI